MRAMVAAGMATLLAAAPVESQDVGQQAFDDTKYAVEEVWHVWSSPSRMEAADMEGVAAALGVTALVALVDQPIQDAFRAMEDGPLRVLAPFREPSPISELGLSERLMPLSAALWAAGLLAGSRDLRDAGTGCFVSNFATTTARFMTAMLLSRARSQEGRGPYVIEPLGLGGWEMRSFPGGHGANITACTTFWTRRFELGAAEPALWTLAGAIGLGRLLDEAHWASDAVFGVILGHAIGRAVADRYQERLDQGRELPAGQRAAPSLGLSVRIPLP